MQIRRSNTDDFESILNVINDAANAYRGVIPVDRWHEPYMSKPSLAAEIESDVNFWIAEEDDKVLGVMGIQSRAGVALIRHAYVITASQGIGTGKQLLHHVIGQTSKRLLVGTWAAASWAIRFYQRNGFILLSENEKNRALRKYWDVPERQIETSVVLEYKADASIDKIT